MTENTKVPRKKKPKKSSNVALQNNVVLFPFKENQTPEITIEQIRINKELIRSIHVDETLDEIVPMVFDYIQYMGFNLSRKKGMTKDITLIVESIKSFLYKYHDMDHPLQKVAEDVFLDDN